MVRKSIRRKRTEPEVSPKEDMVRIKETDYLLKSLINKEREIIQTEDALVESMRRFRDLLQQSPIGVGIHDSKGELLIVNKSYLKVFGAARFRDIMHLDLFADMRMSATDRRKVKTGKVIQYEAEYDIKKSEHKEAQHILFTVSPLYSENKIIGFMSQVQDVTQRKKVEESQRLAQLGRLMSDMAHEVNNPLMIISGRAEMALFEGIKDEGLKDALNVILEQCFFAKEIIQRLLKYSRIGKISKGYVDIFKTLDLIMEILKYHLKISNVRLKKDLKKDLPPVIGNEKQLQEVFINIIRNSADAMPEGGTINVKASKDKDYVKIEIKDTGVGMPEKVMDRIFEPFFTTKEKGTGLGLAVTHTIIQEHGGELKYTSKVGSGTKAVVRLPIGTGKKS